MECKETILIYTKDGDCLVLIETLWNVKKYSPRSLAAKDYRINRNIVECKVHRMLYGQYWKTVLIETLWNVKTIIPNICKVGDIRINRNIVECKVDHLYDHLSESLVLIETLWNVKLLTLTCVFVGVEY